VIRRLSIALWVTGLMVVTACVDRDREGAGLGDAGPRIERFAEAGKALSGLGEAVARESTSDTVPFGFEDRLRELGKAARSVLSSAEPEGSAGVAGISKELASRATEVVRHLVTTAGGTQSGDNSLISVAPDEIAFRVNVPAPPLDKRSDRGKAQAHSRLAGDLGLEVRHFLYVAVLVDAGARRRLTPRLSPEDLPERIDPALNLSVATTEEWRGSLFDENDRLTVPSPFEPGRWKAFLAWAQSTNPAVVELMRKLTETPFDELNL